MQNGLSGPHFGCVSLHPDNHPQDKQRPLDACTPSCSWQQDTVLSVSGHGVSVARAGALTVCRLCGQSWIRRRVRQAGLPRPDSVHLVSSTKQQGVGSLLAELQRTAGPSGDVWVVSPPLPPTFSKSQLLFGFAVLSASLG